MKMDLDFGTPPEGPPAQQGKEGSRTVANPDEITKLADAISIVNVPMHRRRQTAAVASFVCALPATIICWVGGIVLLLNPFTCLLMLAYFVFIFFIDKAPQTGARKSERMRRAAWWKNFADYFPMSLRCETTLDPDKKYVFGYHPHGIISVGALACFGTEGLGFSDKCKGIDVHLVTLPTNFKVPFLREIWILLGICDSSKETFKSVLSSKSGKAVAVVVGGAAESLETSPGHIDLVLSKRKGFVRQALLYGACVVPAVGFGETDVFETAQVGAMKRLQERAQKLMGVAVPIFHGRGVFNKAFGLLPFRRSVNVVIGKPIDPAALSPLASVAQEKGEKWLRDDPEGKQLVDLVHGKYITELQRVYDSNKNLLFKHRAASMVIN
eukprot:Tamp_18674.p1 GENE.Tamp_18674~~Tamp_18674.p1  ORF type:complete len:406 (-),score=78.05 Tamp_18674:88-1236(-)